VIEPAAGSRLTGFRVCRIDQYAVGVDIDDALPGLLLPLVVAQVDTEYRPCLVDGPRHDYLAAPGERVDQLGQAMPITLQLILGQAGVAEMREGKVAREAALA